MRNTGATTGHADERQTAKRLYSWPSLGFIITHVASGVIEQKATGQLRQTKGTTRNLARRCSQPRTWAGYSCFMT